MSDGFKDGDIVWVKCGTLFWPAKVVDYDKLPEEIKEDFPEGNEKPKTIAKFFDEDG
jgi:PWWP domain